MNIHKRESGPAGPVIRTPEERFTNLPGFPFSPHYVEIGGLRVHYVDEGEGELILCLHGVLEWSYSYRKIIPMLATKHRVIAMDHIGFGRSDKLTDRKRHTFTMHMDMLSGFVDALDLRGITLVSNDWGAVVGLSVAARRSDRFNRLVIMNTILPTGETTPNFMFMLWREFLELAPDLPIGKLVRMGIAHGSRLTNDEVQAYEAPFPDKRYKAGAFELPLILPTRPHDPGAALIRETRDFLARWNKPAFVVFSDEDMFFSKQYSFFRNLIPTAAHEPDAIIHGAGHFLHEEQGEIIARKILEFIDRTASKSPLRQQ